jgi:hypothetical protein
MVSAAKQILGKLLRRSQKQIIMWERNRRDRISVSELATQDIRAAEFDERIRVAVAGRSPLLVIRPGGSEGLVLEEFLRWRVHVGKSRLFSQKVLDRGALDVGIVPPESNIFDRFAVQYLATISNADMLIHFPWTAWMCSLGMTIEKASMPHEEFDPIYQMSIGNQPWTRHLANRRVLIVAPFRETIQNQYSRKHEVAIIERLFPEFELDILSPPVTFAGNGSRANWFHEVASVRQEMQERNFDVALVAAGSYGPALAETAWSMGKVGIHVGGILQLFFGIMGTRWDNEAYSQYLGDLAGFVRPGRGEVPPRADAVEGGAYW